MQNGTRFRQDFFSSFYSFPFKSYDLVAKGTFTDIHNSIDQ